jgi:hypothetical protein
VGGGLRFFRRSVAVPLIGLDAGYGIEARHWQFMNPSGWEGKEPKHQYRLSYLA